jgi:hypothetical protein
MVLITMQTYIIKEVRPATDTADMAIFKEWQISDHSLKMPDDVKHRLEIRKIRSKRKFDAYCQMCHI